MSAGHNHREQDARRQPWCQPAPPLAPAPQSPPPSAPPPPHDKRRVLENLWHLLLGLVGMSLLFFLGGLFAAWLFSIAGTPPPPINYLCVGLIGFVFLTLSIMVAGRSIKQYRQKQFLKHGFSGNPELHRLFGGDIIEALERIGTGDFSVFIEPDQHGPLGELAQTVNKLAAELGNLEQQRQDFIASVSHELQSPLTSIQGFAALLQNDDVKPEDRVRYLRIIETEATRLSRLADNLLRLTALETAEEPLTRTTFALDAQLRSVLLMLEPQWSAKQITLEVALERLDYTGDEGLLDQVWGNIIQNAIKFTQEDASIKVALFQEGEAVVCQITDTGIGIDEHDLPHIFERFYRADKARERATGGNGLGLALVRRIVELHGGTVGVTSTIGQGSTFTITLPLV